MNGEPCIRDLRLTVRRVIEALAVYPDREELKREYPELEDEEPFLLPFLAHAQVLCYAEAMTELLEDAMRKVATLPREEQDAIPSQIIETLEDEAAWKEQLARNPAKLQALAEEALREHRCGGTHPLDEIL